MEDSAFRQLIVAQIDAVFRLACHLTRSRQEADDVVQETYLRALRFSATFTLTPLGVRPWLFKILHNVIFTRGAKQQRERDVLDEFRATFQRGDVSDAPTEVAAAIDWDNVDERLKAAVTELPLAYRATFLLSAVEGLSYREIADVIDVPVGTVMSRLSRARAALVAGLAEMATEQRLIKPQRPNGPETPISEV